MSTANDSTLERRFGSFAIQKLEVCAWGNPTLMMMMIDDYDCDDWWLMIDDWWLWLWLWWLMTDDWWLMIDGWWLMIIDDDWSSDFIFLSYWCQFFLAYMARSSNTVPFGPGGWSPWGSPWIAPWIFTDEDEIFPLEILHSYWWFIHWMVHWMVYHPLEDGLRKISSFTIIIDEPSNG